MTEKIQRSIAKAISWRVTGTLYTIAVSYLVTRRMDLALSIGSLELVTKSLLYFLHERLWNRIRFGLVEPAVTAPSGTEGDDRVYEPTLTGDLA